MSVNILKHRKEFFYLKKSYSVYDDYGYEHKLKIDTKIILSFIDYNNDDISFEICEDNNFDYITNEIFKLDQDENISEYEDEKNELILILNEWINNEQNFKFVKEHFYGNICNYNIIPKKVYSNNIKLNQFTYIKNYHHNDLYYEKSFYEKIIKKIDLQIQKEKKKVIKKSYKKEIIFSILDSNDINISIDEIDEYISLYSRQQKIDRILNNK